MKIAIIGAGFSGLAAAYYLSQKNHEVTLFDAKGIGAGASGIAAGLMHPFGGARATLNWRAREAYIEAMKLFSIATQHLQESVFFPTGMLRLAITENQLKDFSKTASLYPDTEWWDKEHGLFIRSAVTVDTKKYLQGLYKAANCSLEIVTISHVDELSVYDLQIYALGANRMKIEGLSHPEITSIKGQLLILEWPKGDSMLPYALNSQGYVAQIEPSCCIAGATFESTWSTEGPDLVTAEAIVRDKIARMRPDIATLPLLECRAGFRAQTLEKKPFYKQLSPKAWALGGMGSKGLLYHALIAKELIEAILYPNKFNNWF